MAGFLIQASGNAEGAAQAAPVPPCEYKNRMNFSIGDGVGGAVHARRVRFGDAPGLATELRMTIEAPIVNAHSDRAEGVVKVTLGLAQGSLPPQDGAGARAPGLQWIHVKSRQLQGTDPDHPAYKRKPKPFMRWSVGDKVVDGAGFLSDGGALVLLEPTETADLFGAGDWTFETAEGFESPWADYRIPAAFMAGIIKDMNNIMAAVEKAQENGDCTVGTAFGEMPRGDIFY
ncbi:hypothetical protein [Qipengyuania sp. JC766]|uniref:hypothetical protein n=1 Tax=Qipengyuania sp. JC766 TaxID=3232139 RepID=UPI00345B0FBD